MDDTDRRIIDRRDSDNLWTAIRGLEKNVKDLAIWQAGAAEREVAHLKEMERMMAEFRSHAGREEITLANVQKKQDEHYKDITGRVEQLSDDVAEIITMRKTWKGVVVNYVPVMVSVIMLALFILKMKG